MAIKEEHKELLRKMGLKDEDFKEFNGEKVKYEFDEKKGIRIYDPYNLTSYKGYIDVDGWSEWSSEEPFVKDMHDILKEKLKDIEGDQDIQKRVEEHLKEKFEEK